MGNSSSRTNDWDSDSDEGGGSDYEHAYNYHTSVLRKSPADGFESDYDDDDDDNNPGGRHLRTLPSRNVKAGETGSSTSVKVGDGGDNRERADGEQRLDRTGSSDNAVVQRQTDSASNCRLPDSPQSGGEVPSSRSQQAGVSGSGARPLSTTSAGQASNGTASVRQTSHSTTSTRQMSHSTTSARQMSHSTIVMSPGSSGQTSCPRQLVSRQERSGGGSEVTGKGQGASGREGGRAGEEGEEEEERYETAGERSGDEGVDSEGGSLSTITPPCTRPQSDSEYTVSEEAHEEESLEEEEEEEEGEESDYDTERVASPASRSRNQRVSELRSPARSNASPAVFPSSQTSHSRLPHRLEMSAESYRLARKRPPPSPELQQTSKRCRPSFEVNLSPNRTRYGIFDSDESESDQSRSRRASRKRKAAPPLPPPPPPLPPPRRAVPEIGALSARTLRLAARRAASQFVETSRKILQDAKTAARMLRESTTGKRRSSFVVEDEEEGEGPSRGKKPWLEEGGGRRKSPRLSGPGLSPRISAAQNNTDPSRRAGGKRALDDTPSPRTRRKRPQTTESDSESESDHIPRSVAASSRQVRKDGGRRRKFTRNSVDGSSPPPTRRSPRLVAPISVSLPVLPGTAGDHFPPSPSPPRRLNNSFPAAAANPFHNVTLRPSPSKPTSSADSEGCVVRGGGGGWPSPFSALLKDADRTECGSALTLSAGSVWARISAHTHHTAQPAHQPPSQGSPAPGTSGTRMATRTSPEVIAVDYPPNSTPRVPSLTLTGQFAHSGRFAFLLENVLQVTVVAEDLTMATTSAVVVTTDSHLQHANPAAQSVIHAAGTGLAHACREFLKRHPRGLQVCEVLDSPAGGRLPPLISHVLHVTVPETEGTGGEGGRQHRKLLLCTYLNCLKHTSEKLALSSLGLPLIGAECSSADEAVQVFFDSLLVYLAERTPHCPLHALQLLIPSPALARFTAEVLEARLHSLRATSVDAAMAAVFREYFNIPDFRRSNSIVGAASGAASLSTAERNRSGKPAVKRRRL